MDEIRQFLMDLQEAWQSGDLDRLAGFYHPDVVLLPPDLGTPIVGRDAVVESYGDFLQAARLDAFEVTDLTVFEFDTSDSTATGMAHLKFDIIYELGDERYVETGLEIYTVLKEGENLAIAWRSQTVLDSRLEEKR